MSKFLRKGLRNLEAYTPGEQPRDKKYIKLNTNESPYPPGPKVLAAITEEKLKELRLYSDPTQLALRKKLAETYSGEGLTLNENNVFCSNGSDDIINFAFSAFVGGEGRVIYPEISYGFYSVFSSFYGSDNRELPMKENLKVDVEGFLEKGYSLKILANPNAPTGEAFSLETMERIASSDPEAVVLIDEAYVDFGGESALPLVAKYPNLLVSRTYSKSSSLAGARLGFAFGQQELIQDLELIKYSTNPYSINRMTEAVGLAVLDEMEYYRDNANKIIETREKVKEELVEMGMEVLPSKTNFLFVRTTPFMAGEEVYKALKGEGILVRWFKKESIKDYLRITIGTPEEMKALLTAMKKILNM